MLIVIALAVSLVFGVFAVAPGPSFDFIAELWRMFTGREL